MSSTHLTAVLKTISKGVERGAVPTHMTTVWRGQFWKGDTRGGASFLSYSLSLSTHHGTRPYCFCVLWSTEKPALPLPLAARRAGDARQGQDCVQSPGHLQVASRQPCPGLPRTPAQGPDRVSHLFRSRSDQTHQRGDARVAVDKG